MPHIALRLCCSLALAHCACAPPPVQPRGLLDTTSPPPHRPASRPAASPSASTSTAEAALESARALVRELLAGDMAAAHRRLHPELARELPRDTLSAQWREAVGGDARSDVYLLRQEPRGALQAVCLLIAVADGHVALEVVVDRDRHVRGLRLRAPYSDELLTRVARETFELLRRADWLSLRATLSPPLARRLPELGAALAQLRARHGEPGQILGAEVTTTPLAATVELECAFARRPVLARLVIDHWLVVTDLFFRPGWRAPGYVRRGAFVERGATVGTARYPLPATLTLPRGAALAPAAVLVHGSGPSDQDATLGPNKPFKDLAWGLASRGVAVLRYVKRTARYRGLAASELPTVNEETMEDARSALALLRRTPGVDPDRVVLVGHSLGGAVAPRLAAADPRVAALVLLAAPARPQGVLLLEQMRYLLSLSRRSPAEQQRLLAEVAVEAHRRDTAPLEPDQVVNGTRGSYWLDLRAHPPARAALGLSIPLLVVQGGRDYQVGREDLRAWRLALAAAPAASFRFYPRLNHLLLPGRGRPLPAEYQRHGHVARELVEDLARWIHRVPARGR